MATQDGNFRAEQAAIAKAKAASAAKPKASATLTKPTSNFTYGSGNPFYEAPKPVKLPEPIVPDIVPNKSGSETDFEGTLASLTAILAPYGMVDITNQIKRVRAKYPQIKSDDILTMIQFDSEYNAPYLARFAGNAELIKKGKKPLTMGEYLSNEAAYDKVFKAYGAQKLSNKESYAKLIGGAVSPEETGDRVSLGYTRVLQDTTTLNAFKKYYPQLTTGDIVGAFLDPENQLPALQKQVTAAEIGGAAATRAFELSEASAMELGTAFNVNKEEAQKGFQDIALMGELGKELKGDTSGSVTSDEMVGYTFKKDPEATKKLRKVAGARIGEFQSGGDFASTQGGVTGLGSAGFAS